MWFYEQRLNWNFCFKRFFFLYYKKSEKKLRLEHLFLQKNQVTRFKKVFLVAFSLDLLPLLPHTMHQRNVSINQSRNNYCVIMTLNRRLHLCWTPTPSLRAPAHQRPRVSLSLNSDFLFIWTKRRTGNRFRDLVPQRRSPVLGWLVNNIFLTL